METTNYERLIERTYQLISSGNLDEIDQIFDRNAVEHTPDPNIHSDLKGIDYFREQARIYNEAFPNFKFDIKEIFVKGDKAMCYVTIRARHTGEFLGISPTNKEVILDMCEMFVFRNNKISEHWQVLDNLSFMQQLGIVTEQELQEKMH